MAVSKKPTSKHRRSTPLDQIPLLVWLFALNLAALVAVTFMRFAGYAEGVSWWNEAYALSTNVLISCFVSFIFYFLLVYIPEARRSSMLKKNALARYANLKKRILFDIVSASIKGGRDDLKNTYELMDELTDPKKFREKFEGGREGDEGYYAFENQMSDETYEFRQIVFNLGILARHLNFLTHNFPFKDSNLFEDVTRLENVLLRIQFSGAGYDESKLLCAFIYEIYAGWDQIDGYIGYDRIQKYLEAL